MKLKLNNIVAYIMYVNVNKIPFQLKVLREVKNSHFYEFCRVNKL